MYAFVTHFGSDATRAATVHFLILGRALQYGTGVALTDRGAVAAGTVGATVGHKLRLVVVDLVVENALA